MIKNIAIVTMVVDQLTAYGLFVHPLLVMWEKLWRIHYKPDYIRLPARLPVGEYHSRGVLTKNRIPLGQRWGLP